jgi:putative heme-binding domain-containing protein
LMVKALRSSGNPEVAFVFATMVGEETHPAVLREICVALRDTPVDDGVCEFLAVIGEDIEAKDLSLLGAWGIGCSNKEEQVFAAMKLGEPPTWTDAQALLVWKLHPKAAVPALAQRAALASLSPAQRKLAADTLAFIPNADAMTAMLGLAKDKASPIYGDVLWWLINRSSNDWASFGIGEKLKQEGILDTSKITILPVVTPPALPPEVGPQLADVLKLTGDATRGATTAQRCIMCHNINGQGVDFGPGLTGWGASQPTEVIAEALINPSKDIAHGFEGNSIRTKKGEQVDGMILAEGEALMVKSVGGQTQLIGRDQIKSKAKMNQSLMLSAAQLGLTAQDVADIIAYLKK